MHINNKVSLDARLYKQTAMRFQEFGVFKKTHLVFLVLDQNETRVTHTGLISVYEKYSA